MLSSNHKGNVAELAIATEAAKLGLSVLKPLTEHERYDLVLEIGGRLQRVQCKWGKKLGEVVAVNLASSRRGADGHIRTRYSADEIDAIGVFCQELNSCFLIPFDVVAGQWAVQLRLGPARNRQRAALHFAETFLLGAVAQLAERRRGTAEARGSNPLSSISPGGDAVATVHDVGAHQFRNHFGYYMERAAAGDEILIRRRGTPHARLGPPDLNSPPLRVDA
jgi:prevent-host-death family protein